MFSKEERKKLREDFWTSFGKEYPHKWILYNTKIKEIQLKFSFTNKYAMVSLDVDSNDDIIRAYYFEKIFVFRNILSSDYLPEVQFDASYQLPELKEISRTYVILNNVSVYNKQDWPEVKKFLAEKMMKLELFFMEYKDITTS